MPWEREQIFIDCYPTNSYRIILNSEYSATSGDFSRKRRELLSFSLLNPLLFSITLYTTLSALLLYYYCEYWMLDHITRLYAVDICTNWVVLGSVIIESEENSLRFKKKKFEKKSFEWVVLAIVFTWNFMNSKKYLTVKLSRCCFCCDSWKFKILLLFFPIFMNHKGPFIYYVMTKWVVQKMTYFM